MDDVQKEAEDLAKRPLKDTNVIHRLARSLDKAGYKTLMEAFDEDELVIKDIVGKSYDEFTKLVDYYFDHPKQFVRCVLQERPARKEISTERIDLPKPVEVAFRRNEGKPRSLSMPSAGLSRGLPNERLRALTTPSVFSMPYSVAILRNKCSYVGQVHSVVDYEDILYAGCDPGLVEDVCSVMPERIDAMWKPSYVKYPEAAAVMLPHLNASKFPNTKALLNAFAKGGFTEAIREMHALGFELTDKSLAKAAQIAAEAGNTETTATLLSLMSESDSQTAAPDLTL